MNQINDLSQFELQNIKDQPITTDQLEQMYALTGSYEKLFNKRAQLYKQMGLKDKVLTEADFKHYILEHYTFLARPVIIYNKQIFVGNSAKVVENMLQTVNG